MDEPTRLTKLQTVVWFALLVLMYIFFLARPSQAHDPPAGRELIYAGVETVWVSVRSDDDDLVDFVEKVFYNRMQKRGVHRADEPGTRPDKLTIVLSVGCLDETCCSQLSAYRIGWVGPLAKYRPYALSLYEQALLGPRRTLRATCKRLVDAFLDDWDAQAAKVVA